MNTLKNFIDNQAEGLLQQSDLVSLTGGGPNGDGLVKDINALADCVGLPITVIAETAPHSVVVISQKQYRSNVLLGTSGIKLPEVSS